MTIRVRISIQYAAITGALLLFSFGFIYLSSAIYRRDEFEERLIARARTTADLLVQVQEVDSILLRTIDRRKFDQLPLENITVYDTTGKVIYTNTDSLDFQTDRDALRDIMHSKDVRRWSKDEFEIVGISYLAPSGKYIVTAGAVDRYGKSKLSNLRRVLFLTMLIGVFSSAIIGWLQAGRVLSPISRLIQRMKQISASNLNATLPIGLEADEMSQLAATFNEMISRLNHTFDLQRTFVANVSHELRTPMTRVSSQLALALMRDRDPSEYKEAIKSSLEDIHELSNALSSFLALAMIDTENASIPMVDIQLDELLMDVSDRLKANYPEFKAVLSIVLPESDEEPRIRANEGLLSIAILNLMVNACKFSEDHTVNASLHTRGNEVRLSFSDRGIGIPPSEVDRLFQPFERGSNAHSRQGYGIGLFLVGKIIALHGGSVSLSSKEGQGTQIDLIFELLPTGGQESLGPSGQTPPDQSRS